VACGTAERLNSIPYNGSRRGIGVLLPTCWIETVAFLCPHQRDAGSMRRTNQSGDRKNSDPKVTLEIAADPDLRITGR
jgi:hypothetical protein